MNLDELSPATIGEEKITLTLDSSTPVPKVFALVQVNVDYSSALPAGIALPLDFIVQGPSQDSYKEKVFRRYLPQSLSFIPIEAGAHLVLLREQAHNRWLGRLIVTVAGDPHQKV
jgi:hypothetical protein